MKLSMKDLLIKLNKEMSFISIDYKLNAIQNFHGTLVSNGNNLKRIYY